RDQQVHLRRPRGDCTHANEKGRNTPRDLGHLYSPHAYEPALGRSTDRSVGQRTVRRDVRGGQSWSFVVSRQNLAVSRRSRIKSSVDWHTRFTCLPTELVFGADRASQEPVKPRIADEVIDGIVVVDGRCGEPGIARADAGARAELGDALHI